MTMVKRLGLRILLAVASVIAVVAGSVAFISIWFLFVVPLVPNLGILPVLSVGSLVAGVGSDHVARSVIAPGATISDEARFLLYIFTAAATFIGSMLVLLNVEFL